MTDAERQELLALYRGLRVTDVCDGMDRLNLHDLGLVDREIRPLWRDVENFRHRIYGFAHTVRFVPTNRPITARTPAEMESFIGDWYRTIAPGPFREDIRAGDVIVIDSGYYDVGFVGSNNALGWLTAGAVGVVTNGSARDTDELIKQQVPVYCRWIGRTIRPGRLEFDAKHIPVNIGGVLVRHGDLVVADGDGVIVVPVEQAREVATFARRVAEGDKAGRRRLYEQRGLPPDQTLEFV